MTIKICSKCETQKPISDNLSNPEEQKECFHYSNLQMLKAEDNLKKSNNYIT